MDRPELSKAFYQWQASHQIRIDTFKGYYKARSAEDVTHCDPRYGVIFHLGHESPNVPTCQVCVASASHSGGPGDSTDWSLAPAHHVSHYYYYYYLLLLFIFVTAPTMSRMASTSPHIGSVSTEIC